MKARYWFGLSLVVVAVSCTYTPEMEQQLEDAEYLHTTMKKLSDIIVNDIFSPPQASRNYVYPCIAAYEVMSNADSSYQSLVGQLKGLETTPVPPDEPYSPAIATVEAMMMTAKQFVHSEDKMLAYRDEVIAKMKKSGVPSTVFKRSQAYGQAMADHIIAWSKGDQYAQIRTFPKYSVTSNKSKWRPTPPGYMDGIEPHWREIRTMVLDSAQQFIPQPPTPFDMTEGSQFYNEVMEAYREGGTDDLEKIEIASFWDCNPFVLNVAGHVMHATKKITPGGHWIGITSIACRDSHAEFSKTVEAYTLTSIALFDAFISCWDEKYRSNLVRPETVINEYIDEEWMPTLQTPPFPEHTSGHSVISTAAAITLTSIFGDDFAFDDTTEIEYGLPVRSFTSFMHASQEAAISRLYGGIHYRPSIDYGVEEGYNVGNLIISRLKLKI